MPKMGKSSGNHHPVSLSSSHHSSDASPVRSSRVEPTNTPEVHGLWPWKTSMGLRLRVTAFLIPTKHHHSWLRTDFQYGVSVQSTTSLDHDIHDALKKTCTDSGVFFLEWEFLEGLENPLCGVLFYHVVRFNYINVTIIVYSNIQ